MHSRNKARLSDSRQANQPITSQKKKRNEKTRKQYKSRSLQFMVQANAEQEHVAEQNITESTAEKLRGSNATVTKSMAKSSPSFSTISRLIVAEHGKSTNECWPAIPACLYAIAASIGLTKQEKDLLERSQPNQHEGFWAIRMLHF